ncbi:ankyrin repeat domain-containing protein [Wolbachia endosymbiont (group B) of Athalia cordata]|uniref:ankyrin repeat domain-containing protein n=1 Tax=Wolbachia endosymbiont (group B) of Athalia cordata TaxID=2953986 RepID=UPI0022310354|nr:ankyrin repeat domain-containing protein [Wolbachia endosymbiont (group B) of Athalia cordata]
MERQEIIESLRKKLFSAINRDDFEKVKEYIEEAEHRHIKNEILNNEKYSMKPMHSATYIGNLKVLQFLCDSGADVNTTISSRYLSTPLHIAAINGKLEIAQFLLDRDANINATNYKGFTPLYLAFNHCHLDMVKLLLCRGADASIQSQYGKTALDVVGGYRKDRCNSNSKIQEIEYVLSSATEDDCEAKLTSIKAGVKVGLDANDATDSVSSAANLSLFPTKAIKIELEVSNTTDLTSRTVNSSFTLIRENFEEVSSTASNAVKPSSFINSIFSWITTTISGLFSSAPALPTVQQSVAHLTGSPIGSSQIDCNGTVLLTAVAISKFTRKQHFRPLDDSPLTAEKNKERELDIIEKKFETALSNCEKLYQCPRSSLSNSTISKGVCHQKSL